MSENEAKTTSVPDCTPALLELARKGSGLSEDTLLEELNSPLWEGWHAKWGVFVPVGIREQWGNLTMESKLAVYLTALAAFDHVDLH